jgi:hypothetical protein
LSVSVEEKDGACTVCDRDIPMGRHATRSPVRKVVDCIIAMVGLMPCRKQILLEDDDQRSNARASNTEPREVARVKYYPTTPSFACAPCAQLSNFQFTLGNWFILALHRALNDWRPAAGGRAGAQGSASINGRRQPYA